MRTTGRPLLILLAVAVGSLGGAPGAATGQTARGQSDEAVLRSYYSANGLLNRGLHDLAAQEYRAFLEAHPDHEHAVTAHYGLGVCLFRLQELAGAIAELRQVLDADGFDFAAEAMVLLGQSHLALKNHDDAAEYLRRVVAEHGDHELADDAAALLVEAAYHARTHDEVDRVSDLIVQRWPDSPQRDRSDLFRALAEIARRRHSAASERLDALLRRSPDGPYAHQAALLVAQSLHRSRDAQGALERYRRVIADAGNRYVPDAMYGLATLLFQQGKIDVAGTTADELLKRYPEDPLVTATRLLRGRVWFEQEQYDRAATIFDGLAEREETHRDDAAYWRAKCDLRRGDPEQAADRLATAIEKYPRSELLPEMTYDEAVARSRADAHAATLEILERFLARHGEHALAPDALHLMAATEHRLERYADSTDRCRRFRERFPEHALAPSVAFLAAENEYLLGNHEDAAAAFRDFLAEHTADERRPRAAFRLGIALYHLGRYDEAEPFLTQVSGRAEDEAAFRPALLALGSIHFQRSRWALAEEVLEHYLALAATAGGAPPAADDALLKIGLSRHRQNDLEDALAAFDTLIGEHEDSPHRRQAIFERGQTLVGLERGDEAAVAFDAVIEDDPDARFTVHALNHLGALAMERGDYVDAAKRYERVVAAEPAAKVAAEAMFQRSMALLAAEQYAPAAAVLSRLVRTHPEASRVPSARGRLVIALARQDLHADALAALEHVSLVDLDPPLRAAVAYERAWCLRGLERTADATRAYRELLGLGGRTDQHDHALVELAELEQEANRYEEASTLLARLLDLDPPAPAGLREQALYRLGVCAYSTEKHERAADLFARFVEAFPKSTLVASASLLGGESSYQVGEHRRATDHFRRVVEHHAKDDAFGPSLLRLGECLNVLQNWDRSEEHFTQYLSRFPEGEQWYQAQFGIGWARENQGRHDEAIAAYRAVVDRHRGPTAARAQFQIGECLFAERRFEDAARELLKVDILYAYPQWSAAALYEAGRCFEEMGDRVKARKHFEDVRRDHADTRWGDLAVARLETLTRTALPGREGGS